MHYAASQLRSIEVNSTFYAMQRPDTYANWTLQVPAGFVFAIKAPRTITHIHRLKDVETPLANFIASGILRLGSHLGPILWQFPPNFRFDPARMAAFFRLLPRDSAAAAELGARHDASLHAPAWLGVDINRPVRHAMEVRHDSFHCPEFVDLLRANNIALVFTDSPKWPGFMDLTADFVYCRLHGPDDDYDDGYDHDALDGWASRIRRWAAGEDPADGARIGGRARRRKRDVFVYFDNTIKIRAPANAMELIRRLRV